MSKTRKKQKKNQDFGKVKLKLGDKRRPANQTKLDVHSRRIVIPLQATLKNAAAAELKNSSGKPSELLIRGISFTECLSRLKHHAPSNRRDGLRRLREFYEQHTDLVAANLSELQSNTLRLLQDEDYGVRQDLLQLYKALLAGYGPLVISIKTSLLVAHLCSGMTHVNELIRSDSLRALKMMAQVSSSALEAHVPKLVLTFASLFGYHFADPGITDDSDSRLLDACAFITRSRAFTKTETSKVEALSALSLVLSKLSRPNKQVVLSNAPHEAVLYSFANGSFFAENYHRIYDTSSKLVLESTIKGVTAEMPTYAPPLLLLVNVWRDGTNSDSGVSGARSSKDDQLLNLVVECLQLYVASEQFAKSAGQSLQNCKIKLTVAHLTVMLLRTVSETVAPLNSHLSSVAAQLRQIVKVLVKFSRAQQTQIAGSSTTVSCEALQQQLKRVRSACPEIFT